MSRMTCRRHIAQFVPESRGMYAFVLEGPVQCTYNENNCKYIIYEYGTVYNNLNGWNINHIKYALRECIFFYKNGDT